MERQIAHTFFSTPGLSRSIPSGGIAEDNIPWISFLVEAAGTISSQNTVESVMEVLCEVLSDHPEGISSSLVDTEFVRIFRKVAERKDVPNELIEEGEKYFLEVGERQGGMLMPQNFRASDCPQFM